MKRSRLKNIINKSKELSNKTIGESSFDKFKKSLPIEVDDNYRLESAWKAYGKPKDYKEALWQGLIQPIDEDNIKLPSIGYNEETDEYEYLNKGRENETVAKDIRVWDNDVIPLVKELKQGGFIRIYDDEKDCWVYKKGGKVKVQMADGSGTIEIDTPDADQKAGRKPIGKKNGKNIYLKGDGTAGYADPKEGPEQTRWLQKGGKPKFEDWYKTVPREKSDTTNYDLEKAYTELPFEELEQFRTIPEKHLDGRFKKPNHMTYSDEGYGWIGSDKIGWTFYPSPRQQQLYPYEKYVEYWNQNEPNSILNYNGKIYKVSPQAFKQGGQMNVIPEGALHARKNNMEGAGEDFTAKGIPVMSNDGEQVAEIEKNEIVFNKEVTDFIEKNYKEFNSDEISSSEKDELAIKVGKRLVKEILENTDDRTGLIEEVANKNNLEYTK